MNIRKRILALREAGLVRRTHTMAFHGEYNIAMHSYNALNIILLLHPNPSMNLVKAVMWHDVPERWTGDVPSPAKWVSPELKKVLVELENRILNKLEISTELTEEENKWLHGADLLELYIWAVEQNYMGNMIVTDVRIKVEKLIISNNDLPLEIRQFCANFVWEKIEDANILLGE